MPRCWTFGLAKADGDCGETEHGESGDDDTVLTLEHSDQPGRGAGYGGLHVARAGAGEGVGSRGRTCFRSVRCCTRWRRGSCRFAARVQATIYDAILNRHPVPPARLNPDLPAKLEEIIHKALEKDRNLRYQHASEMRGRPAAAEAR